MIFDKKRAAEVQPEEVLALVEERVPEEQRLDLKRDPYGSSDGDKREMLRDIVALANGGGGYLVIGIEEDEESRAARICGVRNAPSEVRRMLDLAATGIAPRVVGLETVCVETADGDVIVVRVPESTGVPHMVSLHNLTQFCRRHGTIKREMSMDEIRSAFTEDETSRRLSKIEESMGRIADTYTQDSASASSLTRAATSAETPVDSTPQEVLQDSAEAAPARPSVPEDVPPLVRRTPLDPLTPRGLFIHQADLRADDEMGRTPYYRARVTPDCIDASIEFSETALSVLREPEGTRRGGWHIWKLDLRPRDDGVVGISAAGHYVMLSQNGHMEFRQPLLDTHTYQWRQSDTEAERHPWLYPYALIELPISFFRLAKRVYEVLSCDCSGVATHFLHRPQGLVLYPGHPGSLDFGTDGHEWGTADYRGPELAIENVSSFGPDELVFRLIADLYAVAGFSENDIPLFDDSHRFAP